MTTCVSKTKFAAAVYSALCVLLAFLSAGCSANSLQADAATRDLDATTPLSQMIAAGDSAGIATKARSECSRSPASGTVACYEKFLLPVAEAEK